MQSSFETAPGARLRCAPGRRRLIVAPGPRPTSTAPPQPEPQPRQREEHSRNLSSRLFGRAAAAGGRAPVSRGGDTVTRERDFKRLVRARMRRTGEAYATARAQLRRRGLPPSPAVEGDSRMYPFERFTEHAKKVLTFAQEEAEQYGHGHIGTEHLLLGLLRDEEGMAGRELAALGVKLAKVRPFVEQVVPPEPDETVLTDSWPCCSAAWNASSMTFFVRGSAAPASRSGRRRVIHRERHAARLRSEAARARPGPRIAGGVRRHRTLTPSAGSGFARKLRGQVHQRAAGQTGGDPAPRP